MSPSMIAVLASAIIMFIIAVSEHFQLVHEHAACVTRQSDLHGEGRAIIEMMGGSSKKDVKGGL